MTTRPSGTRELIATVAGITLFILWKDTIFGHDSHLNLTEFYSSKRLFQGMVRFGYIYQPLVGFITSFWIRRINRACGT